jgi:hypothetical protein
MEDLHEFLPDPSPFRLPSFDLFLGQALDGGRTLRPVENQQLFDKSRHLLRIITHSNTLPWQGGDDHPFIAAVRGSLAGLGASPARPAPLEASPARLGRVHDYGFHTRCSEHRAQSRSASLSVAA